MFKGVKKICVHVHVLGTGGNTETHIRYSAALREVAAGQQQRDQSVQFHWLSARLFVCTQISNDMHFDLVSASTVWEVNVSLPLVWRRLEKHDPMEMPSGGQWTRAHCPGPGGKSTRAA